MQVDEIAKQIYTRQSEMEDARQTFGDDWLEIAKYLMPHLEFMDDDQMVGERVGTNIYDSTPLGFMQMMADGMQGHTASSAIKWYRFVPSRPELDTRAVREWLQAMDEHFYYLFQSRSNFYQKIPAFFLNLVGLSMSTVFIDEKVDTGEIKFIIPNPWEIFVEKNQYDERDTVHRKFPMKARNMVQYFNEEDLTAAVKDAAKNTPDKTFDIIHCVFPNTDKDYYKTGAQDREYCSVYIQDQSGPDKKLLRRKESGQAISGYNIMPYIVGVWRDIPDTSYSYGPAHNALPDILMLNDAAKQYWIATQKLVTPPMWLPKKYKSAFSLAPGAKNYYEDEAILDVKPIQQTIDLQAVLEGIQDKREQISNHFMADFFLMLTQSEKPMTATEIMEKQGEKAAALGPVLSSLHNIFNQMFDRMISIEYEAGRLPPPPPELVEAGGVFDIDYIGPLSQAQKRLFETQGTRHFLEHVSPLFQLFPDAVDVLNTDELVKKFADSFGADLDIIRDDEEIQAIREARAKQMQMLQQMEQLQAVGKATKDLGSPKDESSVLSEIEQQAGESV